MSMRTSLSLYITTLFFYFLASSFPASFPSPHFVEKKFISMGTWEHIKLGELPQHNGLRFFCRVRSEIPQKYT